MMFELSNPERKRMGDVLGGQLSEACYYAQRGKPAAILAVQQRYIERACELVMRDGLYLHTEESTEGWVNLWIFKYPHIKNVFDSLHQITDETTKHWILGKICGFDEPSIHEYISKQEGRKKND